MDAHHARAIINAFRTYHGWRYRYVNGSWWRWYPEHAHWDWMDATGRMGEDLAAITRSTFPVDKKIHTQVERQYVQEKLIRELRAHLAHAVLSRDPDLQ